MSHEADSAVQEEGQMGQLSGHSCVVHDQGPGLWSPLGITLLPSSSVLSVLPQVLSHLPLESLFCQCLSFCVSPTAPCTASTCVSPHIPQRVYHHVSPQAPFPHKSLKLPLLDVPSVPPSCQYFLSTCEPKDLPPPAAWLQFGVKWDVCSGVRANVTLMAFCSSQLPKPATLV